MGEGGDSGRLVGGSAKGSFTVAMSRWIHGHGVDGHGEYLVHTGLPRMVFEVVRTSDLRGDEHADIRVVQRVDFTNHDAAALLAEARKLLATTTRR